MGGNSHYLSYVRLDVASHTRQTITVRRSPLLRAVKCNTTVEPAYMIEKLTSLIYKWPFFRPKRRKQAFIGSRNKRPSSAVLLPDAVARWRGASARSLSLRLDATR